MDAIVLHRDHDGPRRTTLPRPEPSTGEALVRTLRVGIDGTDYEVLNGGHGEFPEGQDHLVLGHEAVGVVVDANGTELTEGDVVAPTVRRPTPDGSGREYFERGEADMAPAGTYHERGIVGADGFMAEFFTSPARDLVRVPDRLAEYGFLVEPASISEKALEHAFASRSAFDWSLDSALVLGNGALGLLTLGMLVESVGVERAYCLGRRDRPDPTIDVVEELGATYVDSRTTPVPQIPRRYEPMDLVYEATGYARHGFETVEALAPSGVGALVGVPSPWEFEVDGGALHRDLVLSNKALVGTVNSNVSHFQGAIETLDALPDWLFDAIVTDVVPVDDFERAFTEDESTIKTAIEFSDT
ncbi:glucose 1-dehydrogenase [Halomarina salina]|uniref:Glucose 1-dehydrogenase n=1 Tax=Halomarina salina TaxID=1872699 RepID=A0ABD5RGY7_9EURY|nr:glucose 1-dehydrogenase [Halomarina salina]